MDNQQQPTATSGELPWQCAKPRRVEITEMINSTHTPVRSKQDPAKLMADLVAQYASDELLSQRRGVLIVASGDTELVAIFNNNPWEADRSRRSREIEELHERLDELGIGAVMQGGSVDLIDGTDEPYTLSLICDCGPDQADAVADTVQSVAAVFFLDGLQETINDGT